MVSSLEFTLGCEVRYIDPHYYNSIAFCFPNAPYLLTTIAFQLPKAPDSPSGQISNVSSLVLASYKGSGALPVRGRNLSLPRGHYLVTYQHADSLRTGI